MPITEILEKNCALYGDEVCLVEINPERHAKRHTWKEYELIEPSHAPYYRREITGIFLTRKPTGLPISCSKAVSGKGIRLRSS
jgi:hypothetical protein